MIGSLFAVMALILIGSFAGALLVNGSHWNGPPGIVKRLAIYLGTNLASTDNSPLPEIGPRRYPLDPRKTVEVLREALRLLGWTESAYDPERRQLHAVVTTSLWRFKDDVRIWIEEAEGDSVIHVHARSRVGKGDLGANARHILDLFETLDRLVSAAEQE